MDARSRSGEGWIAFSVAVLVIGGAFAIIDGLVAVYRSRFFSSSAVYVFSDLKTWGWIVFGLGVAAVVAGFAVASGREWARWLGVGVAGLNAVAQLMFAQAYPLWSLMIMAIDVLVIYGLTAYGGRAAAQETVGYQETSRMGPDAGRRDETIADTTDKESRAA
jgi:hypothetical protein